ncbi:adenosylmethionine decarboxylase [Ideonella sp. DXS29W]|uniref:Adenosylmethionine decarboxylase n=1 Tax=Ideonella lacteola TaxID=2984193 RepID=A0ABU9BLY6_9BURK
MQGLHLTADLRGCAPTLPAMTEPQVLRAACRAAVEAAGLRAVGEVFHQFEPLPDGQHAPGITGVVLLAESHLAVHTWPELGAVTVDVYVCNVGADHSARAEVVLGGLLQLFAPASVERHRLWRGALADSGAVARTQPA